MTPFLRTIVLAALLPGAALAQQVGTCEGWIASAANLVEPWEENSRTFANGAVRVAVLDTIEPAAGAYHLMILSPPYSELGDRQCRLVSAAEGIGFSGLSLAGLDAGYDPSRGLTLDIPAQRFLPETGDFAEAGLEVTINQATGEILADLFPAR